MGAISWSVTSVSVVLFLFQFLVSSVGSLGVKKLNQTNLELCDDKIQDNGMDPADIPLFYGWFFDVEPSLSLLKISQLYFSSCFNRCPEFIEFIYNNMKRYEITDPFSFFRKPLDPDTQRPVDLYHVTAKYCGRVDCSSYAKMVAPYVGKQFQIHIIGLFFTAKTYGFRIKLLAEEEDLFQEKVVVLGNSLPIVLQKPIFNEIDYSAILNGMKEGVTDFPDIHFVPQKVNFHPSNSTAHSTIGCAPDIEAKQTGPDLKEIERLEVSNSTPHKDFQIGMHSSAANLPAATLRRYGDSEDPLAFVIYPRDEMIVSAIFNYYI